MVANTGIGVVAVGQCLFRGQSDTTAITLFEGDRVSIAENVFENDGAAIYVDSGSGTIASLSVSNNDFSQGSTSLTLVTTPTSWRASDNYGSTGSRARNGGTANVTDNSTISHGLGATSAPITPSAYGVNPKSTSARFAGVSAASSTTLTVRLRNSSGTAISSAEAVVLWAEQ